MNGMAKERSFGHRRRDVSFAGIASDSISASILVIDKALTAIRSFDYSIRPDLLENKRYEDHLPLM